MSDDLIDRLTGRASFCEDRGEVKTPELLREAAAELTRLALLHTCILVPTAYAVMWLIMNGGG